MYEVIIIDRISDSFIRFLCSNQGQIVSPVVANEFMDLLTEGSYFGPLKIMINRNVLY